MLAVPKSRGRLDTAETLLSIPVMIAVFLLLFGGLPLALFGLMMGGVVLAYFGIQIVASVAVIPVWRRRLV